MRVVRSRIFVLFMLLLLTSCAGGTSGGAPIAVPIITQQRTPQDVVQTFLDNWKAGDYQNMYAALSSQSQSLYTFPVFQAIYEETFLQIGVTDLTYTLRETQLQGASAAVSYDLSIVSPVFGTIDDPARTMRLVESPNGWGIAWSSMDIFDGLAAGSRVSVQSRQEPRADILDRNGRPLVQTSGTMVALYTAQQNMPNVDDCLNLAARLLKQRRYDLQAYFNLFNVDTIFYLGEIDAQTDALEGAALDATCGISGRFPRDTRYYAVGGGAVHVTGYIGQIPADQVETWRERGYEPGDLIGLNGVESVYQQTLAGQPERVLRILSPSGVLLRELGGREGTDPQPVTLTIDLDLQRATAQAIVDAFNYAEPNWAAQGISPGAGAVVIDVKTGAVLAMASFPWFDPGIFNPDTPALAQNPTLIAGLFNDERQPFTNRVTQQQYFPGSTFKIITTTAATAENLMDSSDIFDCQLQWDGRERFGDTSSPRFDWRALEPEDSPKSLPAGQITVWQALAASCNPFFYEMGARLFLERGSDVLLNYAQRMGLGKLTGIDVMQEVAGTLPATSSVEQAINEAIGQGGIQVTMLQMAHMVAGVANGGTLYQPYIVQQVGGADGAAPTYVAEPNVVGELNISQSALDIVRTGMCAVTVDETYGTAVFDFYDITYTVCGKTGTAQTGRREPHGWFVAFAPADDPQIAIAAMVEFSREGSETAGPIVRRILDAYFGDPEYAYPEWWSEGPYVPLEMREGMTLG
ncbi:MAG: hypothetical protein K8L97_27395 [Anaerolineae bacterium]|nr:hypothetical protein [Anaerolineae bacterium]